MGNVSVRDLLEHGGDVLDRVQRGEFLTVTRDDAPVAEIHPLRRAAKHSAELVRGRRLLPPMELDDLRRDLDAALCGDM